MFPVKWRGVVACIVFGLCVALCVMLSGWQTAAVALALVSGVELYRNAR